MTMKTLTLTATVFALLGSQGFSYAQQTTTAAPATTEGTATPPPAADE
jgi:hypothetical protein